MALTPLQLQELQDISVVLAEEFPSNVDQIWNTAIRLQLADLGPLGPGGLPTFEMAVADLKVVQEQIQTVQGRNAGPSSGYMEATLEVAPPGGSPFPMGALGDVLYVDIAPNTYLATSVLSLTPAGPNSVILSEIATAVARTVPAASGGIEVNNLLTGIGFERVLTTSDSPNLTAEFVTLALSPGVPNERVLTAGSGIGILDGGAGGLVTISVDDPLFMEERAAASADIPTFGQFWVRNDAPNVAMFTDDVGNDFVLSGNVSATPTPVANQIAIWDSAGATIRGDTHITYSVAGIGLWTVDVGRQLLRTTAGVAMVDLNAVGNTDAGPALSITAAVNIQGSVPLLYQLETSAARDDFPTFGQWWVRNDVPNTPMFTDDAGNDFVLNDLAAIQDGTADGQIAIWDQTTDQQYEPSSNILVTDSASRINFGANFQMFSPSGGVFQFNNGAGVQRVQFTEADGGVIIVNQNAIRLVGNGGIGNARMAFWSSVGGRPEIHANAASQLVFDSDGGGVLGAVFAYPVGISGIDGATTQGNMQLHSVLNSSASSLYSRNASSRRFPVSNYSEVSYRFNNPTTAADPGPTFFRQDNVLFSGTNNLYFADEDYAGNSDAGPWFSGLNVGDIISGRVGSNAAFWAIWQVDSVTDNGGWWTVGVTLLDSSGTTYINGVDVQFEYIPAALWAVGTPGNVSNTGTPVNNQLAVWTSATVIEGDATLTYDGTFLRLIGSALRVADAGNTDYLEFSHNGTLVTASCVNTNSIDWTGIVSTFWLRDGVILRVSDSGDTDHLDLFHDGTNGHVETHATSGGELVLGRRGIDYIFTQDRVATGNTTGATLIDSTGAQREIGFNDLAIFNDNVDDTLEAGHAGSMAFKDTTTARTLTLAASGDLDFPVEHLTTVVNAFTSGDYTITEGAGTTLYYLDGTTRIDTAGGCTVGPGGVANIWRESATVYHIWGTGITP